MVQPEPDWELQQLLRAFRLPSERTKTLPFLTIGLQSTPKRSAAFLANLRKPTPGPLPGTGISALKVSPESTIGYFE